MLGPGAGGNLAGVPDRRGLALRRLSHHVTAQGPEGALTRITSSSSGRSPARKPNRILQVAATGSWTAYNTWGGSNHYQGITGPKRNQYATTVSLERPWCRGFIVLPQDAPRVPLI